MRKRLHDVPCLFFSPLERFTQWFVGNQLIYGIGLRQHLSWTVCDRHNTGKPATLSTVHKGTTQLAIVWMESTTMALHLWSQLLFKTCQLALSESLGVWLTCHPLKKRSTSHKSAGVGLFRQELTSQSPHGSAVKKRQRPAFNSQLLRCNKSHFSYALCCTKWLSFLIFCITFPLLWTPPPPRVSQAWSDAWFL